MRTCGLMYESVGSITTAAAMRFEVSATSCVAVETSTKFTAFELPPFASIQFIVDACTRSPSELTPIVLPSKSFAVRIGEFAIVHSTVVDGALAHSPHGAMKYKPRL